MGNNHKDMPTDVKVLGIVLIIVFGGVVLWFVGIPIVIFLVSLFM